MRAGRASQRLARRTLAGTSGLLRPAAGRMWVAEVVAPGDVGSSVGIAGVQRAAGSQEAGERAAGQEAGDRAAGGRGARLTAATWANPR